MGDYLTRSTGQHQRQHCKMAFTTMEIKTEAMMIKLLNTLNQILLVHCFLMMMFADFFRTEIEADYIYQEGDDDERSLMDRADSVSSLLPLLCSPPRPSWCCCGRKKSRGYPTINTRPIVTI